MIIEALYAIVMSIATLVLAYLAARAVYRWAIFELLREHRAIVLKHAYLLDEKHSLSDDEARVMAVAINRLYDYDYKSMVARTVLRLMSEQKKIPPTQLRDDVRRVANAFAAIVLVENPFIAMSLLRKVLKAQRDTKASNSGVMPLERAESMVASQIPVAPTNRRSSELATCY